MTLLVKITLFLDFFEKNVDSYLNRPMLTPYKQLLNLYILIV